MNSDVNLKFSNRPKFLSAMAGLAALAICLPSLRAGFFLGDPRIVAEAGGSPFAGLSFLLDRSIWGMSPLGFHVTSALLHAANAMLVFVAGYYLLKRDTPWPAFLGALLFALHPMNTEAVSWISARGELIYTTFFLLSLVSYLNYEKQGGAAWLLLMGVFFFLSLLGSEKALALAAVIPLYAFAASERPAGTLKRLGPVAGVCGGTLVAFYFLGPLIGWAPELAVKNRLFDMGISPGLGYYSEKLVFPFGLELYPQVPESALYMLAGLALVAAVVLLYIWKLRLEAFLVAWVVLALLPSFFVIDYSGAVLDARYLYLPAAAFALLVAARLSMIRSRPALLTVSVVLVASYAFLAFQAAASWKDGGGQLLADALEKDAHSLYESPSQASYVLTRLGKEEMEAGDYEKAREHLREAVRADDKNYMAYYQGGRLFERLLEELDKEGDVAARRALALEAARVLKKGSENFPQFGYPHLQLGVWYMRLSLWDEAEVALRNAVRLSPKNEEAAALLKLVQGFRERGLRGYNGAAEGSGRPSISGRNSGNTL